MPNAPEHDHATYPKIRVFLHWLSACVILWASITGFFASHLARHPSVKGFFDTVNPQVTTLFIPFFGWRLVLYIRSRPWVGWLTLGRQERLAVLVHGALYGLIILVLASGLLMMPIPWTLLGLFPMPVLGIFCKQLFMLHCYGCIALSCGIALHLAAVVYHVARRHNILQKMSFRQSTASNL